MIAMIDSKVPFAKVKVSVKSKGYFKVKYKVKVDVKRKVKVDINSWQLKN